MKIEIVVDPSRPAPPASLAARVAPAAGAQAESTRFVKFKRIVCSLRLTPFKGRCTSPPRWPWWKAQEREAEQECGGSGRGDGGTSSCTSSRPPGSMTYTHICRTTPRTTPLLLLRLFHFSIMMCLCPARLVCGLRVMYHDNTLALGLHGCKYFFLS